MPCVFGIIYLYLAASSTFISYELLPRWHYHCNYYYFFIFKNKHSNAFLIGYFTINVNDTAWSHDYYNNLIAIIIIKMPPYVISGTVLSDENWSKFLDSIPFIIKVSPPLSPADVILWFAINLNWIERAPLANMIEKESVTEC